MENTNLFGFLNINKPKGISSHNVVYILRKLLGIKQIGHSGTLDPMAAGVLVAGIGKATRLFEFLKEEKVYVADMKFGYESETLDTEGDCIKNEDYFPEENELKNVIESFIGETEQIPPKYSAIKIKGKKLYELARQGKNIENIAPRQIKIKNIELLNIDGNTARIKVSCSKGTYVRSLIRDIAQKLGTTAVMSDLVRTKSGLFNIENSVEINECTEADDIKNSLINPLDVLEYRHVEIDNNDLKKVKNGIPYELASIDDFKQSETVILTFNNQIISIGNVIGNKIIQKKVLI